MPTDRPPAPPDLRSPGPWPATLPAHPPYTARRTTPRGRAQTILLADHTPSEIPPATPRQTSASIGGPRHHPLPAAGTSAVPPRQTLDRLARSGWPVHRAH